MTETEFARVDSLADYSRKMARLAPAYAAMLADRTLWYEVDPATRTIGFRRAPGGRHAALAGHALAAGAAGCTEVFLAMLAWGGGVKAYRPSADEAEALANVRADLPAADYRQPFDTLVVELPRAWGEARVPAGRPRPVLVTAWREPAGRAVLAATAWSDGYSTTMSLVLPDPAEPFEAAFARMAGSTTPGSDPMSADEEAVSVAAVRVAVNAAQLLVLYGARREGYLDPLRAGTLEQYLKRKRTRHTDRSRAELAAIPIVYGFAQRVDLYRTEGEGGDGPGDPTGRAVRPHWRRGHLRRQKHGPGLAETKTIFIPAVMVRADRFAGTPAATAVVYGKGDAG